MKRKPRYTAKQPAFIRAGAFDEWPFRVTAQPVHLTTQPRGIMARYILHYNNRCKDCARLAQWNRRLDWLGRFERTTEPSPIGIPQIGDIHVVDKQKNTVFSGAYATQVVCGNIIAYWPLAMLMRIPSVFRRVASRKPGCNGDSCAT
jgi:hypothetical protein